MINVTVTVTTPKWSITQNKHERGASLDSAVALLDKEYRAARAFLLAMGAEDTSPNTADRPTGDAPQPERRGAPEQTTRRVTSIYPERRIFPW